MVTFILARTVLTELSRYGEKLEAIVGLIAIAVLLLVLNWFFHKVYWTDHIKKFNKRRKALVGITAGGLISAQVVGFVLLGFSTVYREGFETVLFLQALELNSGLAVVLEGVALGALLVGAVAVATFVLERKLPYKKMLIVTGVLLTVVLMIMMGKTVRTMQGVGWVPITPIDMEIPYWAGIWLGHLPDRRDAARAGRRRRVRDRQLPPGRAPQAPRPAALSEPRRCGSASRPAARKRRSARRSIRTPSRRRCGRGCRARASAGRP